MCSKLKCSRCRCWKLEKEFVNTHEFASLGTVKPSSRIMRTCNSCRKRNKPHSAIVKAKKAMSQRCHPSTVIVEHRSYVQNSLPVIQAPSTLPCFRPCQDSYVKPTVCPPQSCPNQEMEARSFTVSPSSSNNNNNNNNNMNYYMGLKIAGSSPVNSFEADHKVREEDAAVRPLPFSIPMAQQSSSLPSPYNNYSYPYPYSYPYSYYYYNYYNYYHNHHNHHYNCNRSPYPTVRTAYYPTYMMNPGSAMPPTALSSNRSKPCACVDAHSINCGGSDGARSEKCVLSSLDVLVALSKRELELMKSKSRMDAALCSEKETQSSADDTM